mmetsp:Transcript_5185/g.12991  ORF Transcript_5185/g.12991 Transcript_5185/m.12991 type:complete len:221 (-) Transcript_5185:1118-1780(-)
MVSNTPSHPPHALLPMRAWRVAALAGHTGRFLRCRARFSTDSSFIPRTRPITMTSVVDSSCTTSGSTTLPASPCCSNSAVNSPILDASAVKSNSPSMTSRYARKIVGKSTPLSRPSRFNTSVVWSMLRTSPTMEFLSATSTLTTTFLPLLLSVALCTCAMDAVAIGFGSKSLKCTDSLAPRLRSTVRLMQRKGTARLLSMVREKHSKYASGIICFAVPHI